MLKNKTVVLGVTGGIAAYKAADLVSKLKKRGANVHVVMTEAACHFVTPETFRALSQNPVSVDTFKEPVAWEVEHVALADKADVFVVAPATANCIGKLACGIADDMLSTTAMAMHCKKLLAPAMNTHMYENPILQRNLNILSEAGYHIIPPRKSRLACGAEGMGALAETDVILEEIYRALTVQDLKGISMLVTAGPTREAIDPVRFITNHSSGKMGYAVAECAARRGADVTLVSGPVSLPVPLGVMHVAVTSAAEMCEAVMEHGKAADVIVKAAAVADYRPKSQETEKIKKGGDLALELAKTTDILKSLGENKGNRLLVGFCMETENLLERAKEKLSKKNLDIIVANSLRKEGAGFGTDTNIITILDKDGNMEALPCMQKTEAADKLLDCILKKVGDRH